MDASQSLLGFSRLQSLGFLGQLSFALTCYSSILCDTHGHKRVVPWRIVLLGHKHVWKAQVTSCQSHPC